MASNTVLLAGSSGRVAARCRGRGATSCARRGSRRRCRRGRRASAPRPCGRRRSRRPRGRASPARRARCTARRPPRRGRARARTNGFVSHSTPIVEWPTWPGSITTPGSSAHQHVHHRAAQVGERRRAGRAHAADRAGEERVAGEALDAVDEEREHPVGVARGVEALDPQVARLDHVAVRRASPRRLRAARPRAGARARARRSARGSARAAATWSPWWWVRRTCVTVRRKRSIASRMGSTGPPASISTA